MNKDPSLYRYLDLGSSSKSQSLSPQHHIPIYNKKIPQNHSPRQRPRASIDYVPLPASLLERLAAEQEYMNAKYPKPPKQNIIQRSFGLAKNFLTDGAKILKRAKTKLKPEQNPFGKGSTPPDQRKGYAVGGKTLKNKKPIKKPSNGLKIIPKPPSKPKKVKANKIKPIYR
jgi:hypothetical protein